MSNDVQLSELLHRSGDEWIPEADPARLAADHLAGLDRRQPGPLVKAGGRGSAWRPRLTAGQALRLGLTFCLLGLAVALPLAFRGGGSPSGVHPAAGGLQVTPLRLPSGFVSPSASPAMSCMGQGDCMVVGALREPGRNGAVPAWVELSSGKWTAPQVLDPAVTSGVPLDRVSCPTVTMCVAVSAPVRHGGSAHVYLASFDGTSWHPLAAPAGLEAVARSGGTGTDVVLTCDASGTCTLVATTNRFAGPVYSAQLRGGKWQVLPPVLHSSRPTGFLVSGLSCSGPDDCYLAGRITLGSAKRSCSASVPPGTPAAGAAKAAEGCAGVSATPAVVHWDGTAWRTLGTPPLPRGSSAGLRFTGGISCPTHGECYAVELGMGSSSPRGAAFPQAVDQLNAGTWSVADAPQWPPQADLVACPTMSFCLVAGATGYPQLHEQPYWYLAGGRWLPASVKLPASEYLALLGDLSCSGAGECYQLYSTDTYRPWAAGTSYLLQLRVPGVG